ncbi:MAG: ribosome biogenesis GTPase Der [Alphaproteobacteria bacterium]|nr:ribosome biogenesis GTPase Der [Alphaproteobacteria bacterium]
MSVVVAIVGRPNVGKSTLFNRLVGKRIALVDDTPGVTRDRRLARGRIGDLFFDVLDTAGYEDATDQSLEARMRLQTETAIAEADVILFMIDARAGVTPLDAHFARVLRKSGKDVHLIANKAEGRAADAGINDAYSLGFGEAIALSAEHGLGLADLYAIVADAVERADAAKSDPVPDEALPEVDIDIDGEIGEEEANRHWDPTKPLNVAIIGRPNTGKSTLVNRLVGEERVLTGPEAGITRDSILVPWEHQGRIINLVDTAGMRRKSRVQQKLERLAVSDSLRSLRYAEVVIVMLDATMPFEKQDLQLVDLVAREGRAVVIGLNKWDLIEEKQRVLAELKEACDRLLPQLSGVPMVTFSGLKGLNIDRLMKAVLDAERVWNIRISTAKLNRWLDDMAAAHAPPATSGRRLKLRYVTQVKARPPTFALFTSRPDAFPAAYRRYLINGLRTSFGLGGTPIRLLFRGGENPFANKGKKR